MKTVRDLIFYVIGVIVGIITFGFFHFLFFDAIVVSAIIVLIFGCGLLLFGLANRKEE